ncbi:DUF488 domain-containing protein [Leifsonia sp. fls2-241-R2A-40a]|uniref:DUF488 domain-containing protein n=1 Tax=Leifsonia sp. fls2-241-R2A-40a TaxID=3040290 RepID=UPI00254B087E|nr:DUF488 domain-containing protein [Leifsonia sp. fls2-241-R2A-40a]
MFTVKRIYEPASPDDGYRVLVDRLWPRGISKERAALDLWLKEVAPSTELRRWFHHDAAAEGEVFDEFRTRYEKELDGNPAVAELRRIGDEHPTVTLLVGARDPELDHGVVLKQYLEQHA